MCVKACAPVTTERGGGTRQMEKERDTYDDNPDRRRSSGAGGAGPCVGVGATRWWPWPAVRNVGGRHSDGVPVMRAMGGSG